MAATSGTVKAAWIAGASAIIVAIIGAVVTLTRPDPKSNGKQDATPHVVAPGSSGHDNAAINNAGITAGRDVTTTINVEQKDHPKPEDAVLFVDQVDVVKSIAATNQRDLTVDVTLRNNGDKPANATNVIFWFDRDLNEGRLPQDMQPISGVYVVSIYGNQATTSGPVGELEAAAWYPSEESKKLIVKAPISQTLRGQSTDRIRVSLKFKADAEIKGPMKSLLVGVDYNGEEQAQSKPIQLSTVSKQ